MGNGHVNLYFNVGSIVGRWMRVDKDAIHIFDFLITFPSHGYGTRQARDSGILHGCNKSHSRNLQEKDHNRFWLGSATSLHHADTTLAGTFQFPEPPCHLHISLTALTDAVSLCRISYSVGYSTVEVNNDKRPKILAKKVRSDGVGSVSQVPRLLD